ncbi:alcohol oxidase [Bimuria novae-zelandiae CBS 107.79]|uniref:Alcohol oxidase n=1 Tax=Bimuria novae-zelandiae CBS 107.79 TaxID=1447943 RepID=A0A6A5UP36_9PLEO|nr:alcohol oxidase [Bimuria novae-zelandiae CBS 107.79]
MHSGRWHLKYFVLSFCSIAVQAQWFPQFIGGHLTGTSFGIPGRNATYDYVIIGGRTAGSVVAARLVEGTNATVAVVEAGTFYELSNGNLSQVPYYSQQYSGLDWQSHIESGMFTGNRPLHYAQGKNLGGSSGRNPMLYNRGTKGPYDLWAEEVGDNSYRWDNFFLFFEKSINFTPPDMTLRAANASANYSTQAQQEKSGPLHVHYPNYAQPISSYGPEAYAGAGFSPVQDFISGDLNGYNYFAFAIDLDGNTRSSAETAFFSPAMSSGRLTVYQSSTVRKILFDRNKRAIGVEIDLPGLQPYDLNATKEVILSAGALRSPQLLMLSEIGLNATMSQLGIPTVSALDFVGQNMHDSCAIGGISFQMTTPSQTSILSTEEDRIKADEQFRVSGTGPLTNIGADFASVNVILVATTSRGHVTINSTNVFDQPVIKTNWLSTIADQEVAVDAYRRVLSTVENIEARVGDYTAPNSTILSDNTLLLQYIQDEGVGPIHHASITCRMGREGDATAVVDPKGRVSGVQRLRVIDSSSFGFTPPGHTQAATYGHTEKLVTDVIRDGGYADRWNETVGMG